MITTNHWSVWVYVDVHGSRLEFVLGDTARRNKKDEDTFYVDQLADMLDDEFSGDQREDASIDETQAYGDISFKLVAGSYEELRDALPRFEEVVNQWTGRFNVNNMKDDPR